MTTVNQVVWRILQNDLAIQKDLSRKVINTRALAKHIIKTYGLQASLDAIISAIRRFEGQTSFDQEERALLTIFKKAVISTKNNVACVTLAASAKDFFKKACVLNGAGFPCRMEAGSQEIKVFVDKPHLEKLLGLFQKDDVISTETDLSEISLTASEEASETKGVLARISSELFLAGINVEELLVCQPEFLIYVKQKDIVQAHESLMKLTREE